MNYFMHFVLGVQMTRRRRKHARKIPDTGEAFNPDPDMQTRPLLRIRDFRLVDDKPDVCPRHEGTVPIQIAFRQVELNDGVKNTAIPDNRSPNGASYVCIIFA